MSRRVVPVAVTWMMMVVPTACDETSARPADDESAQTTTAPECDELGDALTACAEDESCDAQELAQQFAACTNGDKADAPRGVSEEQIDALERSLLERARQCYDDEDLNCLWWTYYALASGAAVLGLPTASSNMFNFLQCGPDPLELDAGALRADVGVQMAEQDFNARAWCLAVVTAEVYPDSTQRVTVGSEPVTAAGKDLWYGLGTFTMHVEADIVVTHGEVERVDLHYVLEDRYDWHAGLQAGGGDANIGSFRDDWALWLAEEGAACEYDMQASWSTFDVAPEPGGCGDPSTMEPE